MRPFWIIEMETILQYYQINIYGKGIMSLSKAVIN